MAPRSNPYLPSKASELQQLLGLIPHPEGGFFLETFRSGSVPMASRGQTDFSVDLVDVPHRKDKRPDQDSRRNCLTSIFWVPTKTSPRLPLTINQSDHVHYYQGGKPFEYTVYDPKTGHGHVQIVGPDLVHGHVLQFAVPGGMWKCGRMLPDACSELEADYSLLAEAVAPGFDFHDFCFVNASQLESVADLGTRKVLEGYLHGSELSVASKNQDFDSHYD